MVLYIHVSMPNIVLEPTQTCMCDRLLHTRSQAYVPSLKWKPPSENSIDFKLVLRFPPLKDNPTKPDFCAKPFFLLHVWCGDDRSGPRYEEYDVMYVDDDEWEKYVSQFSKHVICD
jgi:hypothetical protein